MAGFVAFYKGPSQNLKCYRGPSGYFQTLTTATSKDWDIAPDTIYGRFDYYISLNCASDALISKHILFGEIVTLRSLLSRS